jgi:hypothetical protein
LFWFRKALYFSTISFGFRSDKLEIKENLFPL